MKTTYEIGSYSGPGCSWFVHAYGRRNRLQTCFTANRLAKEFGRSFYVVMIAKTGRRSTIHRAVAPAAEDK